jgi:hypothetical protein
MGLPHIAGNFMFELLHSMNFHLITRLRKSESSFNNATDNMVGQGVLQGSSSAAPMYVLNSYVCLATYKEQSCGAAFSHLIQHNIIRDHMVQYVVDTSQFLNAQEIPNQIEETPFPLPPSLIDRATTHKNGPKLY